MKNIIDQPKENYICAKAWTTRTVGPSLIMNHVYPTYLHRGPTYLAKPREHLKRHYKFCCPTQTDSLMGNTFDPQIATRTQIIPRRSHAGIQALDGS